MIASIQKETFRTQAFALRRRGARTVRDRLNPRRQRRTWSSRGHRCATSYCSAPSSCRSGSRRAPAGRRRGEVDAECNLYAGAEGFRGEAAPPAPAPSCACRRRAGTARRPARPPRRQTFSTAPRTRLRAGPRKGPARRAATLSLPHSGRARDEQQRVGGAGGLHRRHDRLARLVFTHEA